MTDEQLQIIIETINNNNQIILSMLDQINNQVRYVYHYIYVLIIIAIVIIATYLFYKILRIFI